MDRLIVALSLFPANPNPNDHGKVVASLPRLRENYHHAHKIADSFGKNYAVFCQHGGQTRRVGNCGCDSPW